LFHVAPIQAGKPVQSDVSVRTLPIQDATCTSYVAVWTNAAAANVMRAPSVNPPAPVAARTSAYCSGEVTMATDGWFLAAARTIDGPPMSICSTHSSAEAPVATVCANG
jgi:hypothetical protein